MRMRVVSILPNVTSRVLAITIFTTLQGVTVLAADHCITKPDFRATKGGHWYYHFDAVKNHKCWFLREQGVSSAEAVPDSNSSLSSLLAFASPSESRQRALLQSGSATSNSTDALRRVTMHCSGNFSCGRSDRAQLTRSMRVVEMRCSENSCTGTNVNRATSHNGNVKLIPGAFYCASADPLAPHFPATRSLPAFLTVGTGVFPWPLGFGANNAEPSFIPSAELAPGQRCGAMRESG